MNREKFILLQDITIPAGTILGYAERFNKKSKVKNYETNNKSGN